MWTWLASLIGGPVITGLINAYKAKLDASNTQDRIAADLAAKEIEAEIAARKAASAIIIAEQGRWYTAIIRPLLAIQAGHLPLESDRLGQGARPRHRRSHHRHGSGLDRYDHYRVSAAGRSRKWRASSSDDHHANCAFTSAMA